MAYVIKHQHAGRISDFVFTDPPTDAQMQAVGEWANSIWGPGWIVTAEVSVFDAETVPVLPVEDRGVPALEVTGTVGMSEVIVGGVGEVIYPPGFDPENPQ